MQIARRELRNCRVHRLLRARERARFTIVFHLACPITIFRVPLETDGFFGRIVRESIAKVGS